MIALKINFIFLLSLLLTGCFTASSRPLESLVKRGDLLPITTFETIDGEIVDFSARKNKLLFFFNTWCPHSNNAVDDLLSSPLLKDKNIQIVAIARGEGGAYLADWWRKKGLPVPLVEDFYRNIFQHFATNGVPRFYIVDKHNRVLRQFYGWSSEAISQIIWHPLDQNYFARSTTTIKTR